MSKRLLTAAAILAALAGCQLVNPPKPAGSPNGRVALGELYKPGLVAYDEFFSSVHELQVEMAGVADDRKAARSTLVQSLGLLPNAPSERAVQLVRERAADLKKAGGRFVVAGTSASVEGKAPGDEKVVAQGLSSCLGGERDIVDRMNKMPERAESLISLAGTLEGSVDADFGPAQRGQVKNELASAKLVLRSIIESSKTHVRVSEKFSDDLVMAATGSHAQPAAPAPSSTAGKPAPTGKPSAPATSKPASTPAPTSKPRPAPTGAPPSKPPDDFNP